ncbi:MAG: tail-specific protease [Desulfobacterales bacterium RIFOXYA12_FULL_46_15]|nr:MAG: tail-specific protease [Desulfobacterales bacterium RIFOXYA12_FULL_46_15]
MRHHNRNRFDISILSKYLLSIIVVTFFTSALWAQPSAIITPKPEYSSQCINIIQALERNHYSGKTLDNEMSSNILNRYIKQLDPMKQLFTLPDINQFNQYQFRFDNELKKGNLQMAFEIFNLYMARSKEKFKYISLLIQTWEKDLDFTQDESMVIDEALLQWKPDKQSLYLLWKKDLKNHIISLILDNQDKASITDTLKKTYSNRLKHLLQTNAGDIFQVFMNSVTSSFDPHTQYFPPNASEDFDIHMSLSLEGIGAVLQNEYEFTKVVRLIPKGPADKSQLLMPGDKIIGVGQGEKGEIKDAVGQRIDTVVKMIRGPKDTFVRLKIIPAQKNDSTKTIQIKREKVKLEEQAAKKNIITLSSSNNNSPFKIGIIEIPTFYLDFNAFNKGDQDYKSTTKDVKKLLFELKQENIDGLIIDLRDNGGGSLKEANELTGLFLKTGPTVQIKTKSRISRLYDENPSIEYSGPLMVLINRMSASASEIFAGAIKDYHRGIIVGTRSFGKGTVQELQPLGDGKLKITSAKFYRVSGESTQNLGVTPDLQYPQLYKIEDTGESSLDGSLPWDQSMKTTYSSYPPLDEINRNLLEQYKERSWKDPGLNYLKKRIEMADELNSKEALSLNLETRKLRKNKYEKTELDLKNEYLKTIGKKPIEKTDQEDAGIEDVKAILMNQTYLVMSDFINFSKTLGLSWQ